MDNYKNTAIQMISDGESTCVTVKDNKIVTSASPRGIAYIIDLYEQGMLKGVFVADKIVGKAAAIIFTLGGIDSCYAENISHTAIEWLQSHNIPVTYKNSSEYIQNRKGDGMCPMESTVLNITDPEQGLFALKAKIAELKQNSAKK